MVHAFLYFTIVMCMQRETSTEEAQSQGLASVAEDTYEVPSDGAQVVKDTNAVSV